MIDNLTEAIAHANEVAENVRYNANTFTEYDLLDENCKKAKAECLECAADHEQLAAWLTELQERREADKWISVKERMPDTNDFVLVYDGSDMFVAWYENKGMSEGWHSFDVAYDSFTPIIAWKPLPKAPESEDNK